MNTRIGIGSDFHRLTKGTGFRLGGIWIASTYACVADSDGDVLLHALTDALLGTFGLGDIGERYPASSIVPGQESTLFVQETLQLLAERGATVSNVDCIVDLEQPKLSPYKTGIRENLAAMLSLPLDRVGLKTKTREGCDAVGQGNAIAAQVAVLVNGGRA